MSLMHHSYAHAVIVARLEEAEQARAGQRLISVRHRRRQAARAAALAQHARRLAERAEHRARLAGSRAG
ncbi:MAG: hypothetical protein QM747_00835 [Nocardioides sp.]